eukprot:CAMPEP_0182898492 /NCGR_PEP_ID=MMETSP0034_2-20130328/27515_1 /TAXON_ID=156128 /ORGANISM="Nephroselmis pyriformis, Strain CCMP717" /LENGTH=261 /DNA_ID=CAMNT_0025032465 /DNA_START=62 /DNA_END=844 /DNA_ORIENTATION=-
MGALLRDPLAEFVRRSVARGQCDASGVATGFPVPWAFTLATHTLHGGAPSCRSIGIHHVDGQGWIFTTRGAPGGASGLETKGGPIPASLCYIAGNYPGADFEEQWRGEGHVEEVALESLGKVRLPDQDLEVQVVASAAFASAREAETGSRGPADGDGRMVLLGKDGEALAGCVADAAARQARHAISPEEITRSGFRAYRLVPTRVEILEGGPTWPQGPTRHEWCWAGKEGVWLPAARILPYNVPPPSTPAPTAAGGAIAAG